MPELAVDRHEGLRPNHIEEGLQFFLSSVSGHVHSSIAAVKYGRAGFEEAADDLGNRRLIAGDRGGADQDGVVRIDVDEFVAARGNERQGGKRFSLTSG